MSAYLGSISRAQARRPTRSAASIVVPDPTKLSKRCLRRGHILQGISYQPQGLDRRMGGEIVDTPAPKGIGTCVGPNVGAVAAKLAHLNVIAMGAPLHGRRR